MGATQAPEASENESDRTTARRSRIVFPIIAVVLIGAIGLALVDMVGQSDRETAMVSGGVAYATTTARDFGFVPAFIKVAPGVPLRLKIQNQGAHTHTLTIASLGVDVVIPPRTTRYVTLRPPSQVGQYIFFCRFHQSFGMRGTIVVKA
jgi:plastocyanin